MKKAIAMLCLLAIAMTPVVAFAEAPEEVVPVQVLKGGVVTPALQEPEGVNWVTGKGRKDWVLEWAVEDNYLLKTPGMLIRGLENVTFGWVDLLTAQVRWNKNSPPLTGMVSGLIMGPTVTVLRTLSGALDVATCWVPFWHGIPMKKQVLGLHDVHNYGTIDDVTAYNTATKRYFFNGNSDEY